MSRTQEFSPTESALNSPLLRPWISSSIVETSPRFNLAQSRSRNDAIDIVARDPITIFGRFLIVNPGSIDTNIWNQLSHADVARLPLLRIENDAWTFGVKDGLKPLVNEALFGRQSSATYISDPEIYHELGALYRSAYDATGSLLLEGPVVHDSPMDHVAIFSFNDEQNLLYLHPPYRAAPEYQGLDRVTAGEMFAHSIEARLAQQLEYHDAPLDVSEPLIAKAREGFNGA